MSFRPPGERSSADGEAQGPLEPPPEVDVLVPRALGLLVVAPRAP